jgi:hypothetical protein
LISKFKKSSIYNRKLQQYNMSKVASLRMVVMLKDIQTNLPLMVTSLDKISESLGALKATNPHPDKQPKMVNNFTLEKDLHNSISAVLKVPKMLSTVELN